MSLLLNHPYKDKFDGGILIPLRIEDKHVSNVIYCRAGEKTELVMSLRIWEENCEPVEFKAEEGA